MDAKKAKTESPSVAPAVEAPLTAPTVYHQADHLPSLLSPPPAAGSNAMLSGEQSKCACIDSALLLESLDFVLRLRCCF